MSDTHSRKKWKECQQRLEACTIELSTAQARFVAVLNQRANLRSPIQAAEKAEDSAALAALYKQEGLIDVEYDAAARAFAEAHRKLEITCRDCDRAAPASEIAPLGGFGTGSSPAQS